MSDPNRGELVPRPPSDVGSARRPPLFVRTSAPAESAERASWWPIIGLGIAFLSIVFLPSMCGKEQKYADYTVRRGEDLTQIGKRYGVSVEAMGAANESTLKALYNERCPPGGVGYSTLYCNSGYANPWMNSVLPGDKIRVPVP